MEISFADERTQKQCQSQRLLQKAHGQACARKVMTRLADLEAASSLDEPIPGRCHELIGNRKGQLALDLADGKRLIFQPTKNPPPTKPDGGLDWSAIDAVRILEICDYHDG
jgi:proteic killer suppression protein